MERLIALLKDGNARTVELLAKELDTSVDDVNRQLEYLENMGIIRSISFNAKGCGSCSACSGNCDPNSQTCKGCIPEGGFKNMGRMWEVIK